MRRRFQTGHVFQRGKRPRMWVARYSEPILEGGKLRSVLRSRVLGPSDEMTKSQARRALQELLRPLNEGVYQPVESAGFAEFFTKWERDLLPTFRESTRRFYHDTARRWIYPYFQNWRVAAMTPSELQRFINLFGGRYSRSVLKHLRATLSCLMETAVKWRYLRENPAAGLRLPEGTAVKRARVLSAEELRQVLGELQEPYRTMVLVGALSGMRASEILGLRWEDVDSAAGTISVRRRFYRGSVAEPKTQGSQREIPVHGSVIEALTRLQQSEYNRGEFVFTSRGGTIYRPDSLSHRVFVPLAKRLGMGTFTWRSLRRSAASALHREGVSLKVQQSMLGHAQPEMSLLYAEADGVGKRQAAQLLGELIFPNLSQVGILGTKGLAN